MNAYPIGNDLTVKWSLLYSDGSVFPLSNYDYELSYRTNRGNKVVTDTSVISVDENILTWTFKGDEQVVSGRYTICLRITLSGSKVVELQYDNAFMLSPLSGFKGAGSEIVLQSYCDAIDLKDAVLQARKAMDIAANAVVDTANSARDAKAAKAAAEVTAAQAKADAESAKTMAADAKDKVAVAEKAATDASRDAVAAQQAAQTVSDHITSLQQAIAELPDGQAVTEKVAEHTIKLTELDWRTADISVEQLDTKEDRMEVCDKDGNLVASVDSNGMDIIGLKKNGIEVLTNNDLDGGFGSKTYIGTGSLLKVSLSEIECEAGGRIYFETNDSEITIYYGVASSLTGKLDITWVSSTRGYVIYDKMSSTHIAVNSLDLGKSFTFFANVRKSGLNDLFKGNKLSSDINYLNPETKFAQKFIQMKYTGKELVLAQFSDIHSCANDNLPRIIAFCNKYTQIDDIINCGDSVSNSWADKFDWNTPGSEKILNVIGNHDTATYSSGAYNWTAHVGADAYNRYIAPFITNWGVQQSGNTCYYYKDYADKRIRLIVLDCIGYDEEQNNWLSETLGEAKSLGYSVVVSVHCLGTDIEVIKCNYSVISRNVLQEQTRYNSYMVHMVDTVQSFIESGGIFLSWLIGHSHVDAIGKVKNTNQLVIAVDTAQYGSSAVNTDCLRVKGDISQDSFNIVSINADTKVVTVTKVGNNIDKYQRVKDSVCINADNCSIII